ncbi:MAG: enoyl-ACP reductase [Planctomycetes bacterium]|nr:enoyl-ACP reductase [Planctomycetota bacterium]MCB9870582.1 enoyl-ACP reductase [Planctomycetota bacterium]
MGEMDGKTAVIFGVANKRSIAWAITRAMVRDGARVVLNYQNERMEEGVRKLAEELPKDTLVAPCDVTDQEQVGRFFAEVGSACGGIDALVHSVAFAKREELGGRYVDTSLDGYLMAQHVSAYSLVTLAKAAEPLMEGRNASVLALTYLGAERVVESYNVMGVAKAALEASVRYLAADLGPAGTRVNAISAGPIKTLSAMGVSGFSDILKAIADRAPLRRNVTQEEVGETAAFLLSSRSSGITGQVIYVDAGFCIMGT